MASIQYNNDAYTTLAASLTTGAVTATVAPSTLFPTLAAGDWFWATLIQASTGRKEVVRVTAVAGISWTIVRAAAPLAFSIGDGVYNRVNEELLDDLRAADSRTYGKFAVAGGTANAMTLTLDPAPYTLVDGMEVEARPVGTNTVTGPTLNVNSLGAKTIVRDGNRALELGDYDGNYAATFRYRLSTDRFELLNPRNIEWRHEGGSPEFILKLTHGTVTGGNGVFLAGNYLYGRTSTATGLIAYVSSTFVYLRTVVGTFSATEVLEERTSADAGATGDIATASAKANGFRVAGDVSARWSKVMARVTGATTGTIAGYVASSIFDSSYTYAVPDFDGATLANEAITVGVSDTATFSGLALSSGAARIGYIQSAAGAVASTTELHARQFPTVFDYLTAAQIADVQSGAMTLVLTAAIQAAINAHNFLYFPPGSYRSKSLTIRANLTLYGAGPSSILRQDSEHPDNPLIFVDSGSATAFVDNITIRNMKFLGEVPAKLFHESQSLTGFSGVRNLLIHDCEFSGFRSDGISLYSGTSAGVERHNKKVRIRDCLFDGINNDNRQGISVVDVDDLIISGCTFRRVTRSDMPGSIDLEPDANTFGVIRNITIDNNVFESTCGGGVGIISIILSAATFTNQPKNISIINNKFDASTKIAITFGSAAAYAEPIKLTVTGNSGRASKPIQVSSYLDGLVYIGNDFYTSSGALFGVSATDVILNAKIVGNTFHSIASTAEGPYIPGGREIAISGNTFSGWLDAAMRVGVVGGAVSNMSITGNNFVGTTGAGVAVVGVNSVIDGKTCVFANNTGIANHSFGAWRTDNCGSIVNGITATTFNALTAPDTFPLGATCMSALDGDTAAPVNAGLYQGILTTFRPMAVGGYSHYIYQTYYHANNGTLKSSYYIRRRQNAANAWEAWVEQAP